MILKLKFFSITHCHKLSLQEFSDSRDTFKCLSTQVCVVRNYMRWTVVFYRLIMTHWRDRSKNHLLYVRLELQFFGFSSLPVGSLGAFPLVVCLWPLLPTSVEPCLSTFRVNSPPVKVFGKPEVGLKGTFFSIFICLFKGKIDALRSQILPHSF